MSDTPRGLSIAFAVGALLSFGCSSGGGGAQPSDARLDADAADASLGGTAAGGSGGRPASGTGGVGGKPGADGAGVGGVSGAGTGGTPASVPGELVGTWTASSANSVQSYKFQGDGTFARDGVINSRNGAICFTVQVHKEGTFSVMGNRISFVPLVATNASSDSC